MSDHPGFLLQQHMIEFEPTIMAVASGSRRRKFLRHGAEMTRSSWLPLLLCAEGFRRTGRTKKVAPKNILPITHQRFKSIS